MISCLSTLGETSLVYLARLFYLWRSRAGLGLLHDILLLLLLVMLVDIFVLLSRRPPKKIFIKTKL